MLETIKFGLFDCGANRLATVNLENNDLVALTATTTLFVVPLQHLLV